ncbi:valyl-tRNA synthetase [Bradyrhizobium sp. JR4.1]
MTAALQARAFDDAAKALYRFIWNVVCDWYVELAKPVLNGDDEAAKAETRAMAAWTLDVCIKLLHPVMPFITEELWHQLGEFGPARGSLLLNADWPTTTAEWIDAQAEAEIGLVIAAVTEGRSVRTELNVPPAARPALLVTEADPTQRAVLQANAAVIVQTLRVSELRFEQALKGAIPFVVEGVSLALRSPSSSTWPSKKARLAKEIATLQAEADRTRRKLDNPDFVARAPEEVVDEHRERLIGAEAAQGRLNVALSRLGTDRSRAFTLFA